MASEYDDLSIDELRERLVLAERVCVLFGWRGVRGECDRDLATSEAWMEWAKAVGSDFTSPRAHPELDDEAILALADRRRTTRMATLERIHEETDRAE